MKRHSFNNERENECIARIRDEELVNPAPFSNEKVVIFDSPLTDDEYPIDQREGDRRYFIESIAINRIIGIGTSNNLDDYEKGMTFREVLFECLHGASLSKKSLEYFISDSVKSDKHTTHPEYSEYPQDEKYRGYLGGKAYGRGGVGFIKRGGFYYATQGKQRSIIAMFYIYQMFGAQALYKNIRVLRYA